MTPTSQVSFNQNSGKEIASGTETQTLKVLVIYTLSVWVFVPEASTERIKNASQREHSTK